MRIFNSAFPPRILILLVLQAGLALGVYAMPCTPATDCYNSSNNDICETPSADDVCIYMGNLGLGTHIRYECLTITTSMDIYKNTSDNICTELPSYSCRDPATKLPETVKGYSRTSSTNVECTELAAGMCKSDRTGEAVTWDASTMMKIGDRQDACSLNGFLPHMYGRIPSTTYSQGAATGELCVDPGTQNVIKVAGTDYYRDKDTGACTALLSTQCFQYVTATLLTLPRFSINHYCTSGATNYPCSGSECFLGESDACGANINPKFCKESSGFCRYTFSQGFISPGNRYCRTSSGGCLEYSSNLGKAQMSSTNPSCTDLSSSSYCRNQEGVKTSIISGTTCKHSSTGICLDSDALVLFYPGLYVTAGSPTCTTSNPGVTQCLVEARIIAIPNMKYRGTPNYRCASLLIEECRVVETGLGKTLTQGTLKNPVSGVCQTPNSTECYEVSSGTFISIPDNSYQDGNIGECKELGAGECRTVSTGKKQEIKGSIRNPTTGECITPSSTECIERGKIINITKGLTIQGAEKVCETPISTDPSHCMLNGEKVETGLGLRRCKDNAGGECVDMENGDGVKYCMKTLKEEGTGWCQEVGTTGLVIEVEVEDTEEETETEGTTNTIQPTDTTTETTSNILVRVSNEDPTCVALGELNCIHPATYHQVSPVTANTAICRVTDSDLCKLLAVADGFVVSKADGTCLAQEGGVIPLSCLIWNTATQKCELCFEGFELTLDEKGVQLCIDPTVQDLGILPFAQINISLFGLLIIALLEG